jgi:membrane protease YdiL (CAAX protease family)
MTDSPLTTNAEESTGAVISTAPKEQGFFRSPALPFGFVRVCLYLILGNGITYGLLWLARSFLKDGLSPYAPQRLMAGESTALLGAFSSAWLMSRLEGRAFGAYGLPLRGAFGKLFWQGALFGLTEISVVVGAMAALGSYHFGAIAIHGAEFLRWAIFWAVFFIFVGLYEEFAFRGYVQFTFAQGLSFWPAAVLLSIAFGLIHARNPGETWVGLAGIVLTGLFWCFALQRTGNLWFAVGMHAIFDFGETFLYSVPDSGMIFPGHLSNATLAGPSWLTGGTAGPEASVFDFLVLLLFFYVFHRLYPAKSPHKQG